MSNSEPADVVAMLAVGVTTTDEGLEIECGRSLPSMSPYEAIGDRGFVVARDELRGGTTIGGGRVAGGAAGVRRGRVLLLFTTGAGGSVGSCLVFLSDVATDWGRGRDWTDGVESLSAENEKRFLSEEKRPFFGGAGVVDSCDELDARTVLALAEVALTEGEGDCLLGPGTTIAGGVDLTGGRGAAAPCMGAR